MVHRRIYESESAADDIYRDYQSRKITINEAIDLLKDLGYKPHEAINFLGFDDSQGGMRKWQESVKRNAEYEAIYRATHRHN
jgi:hypothetical protein